MIDHDRIFKELIKAFFLEFIELFFPEVHKDLDPDSIEFLDKQVFTDVTEGEKHEADLVVKARFRGQASFFLFHIEAESGSRTKFRRRMFTYFARLHEDSGLPVYPIAVLSYDRPRSPAKREYRVEFPGFEVLRYNFRVVQVNQYHWRDFLKHENPVAAALMAKMQMTPQERKQVKFECLRLMLTLKLDPARMQMIAGFVDTYLRLEPRDERWVEKKIINLDPETREKFMEVITHWEERALEKGKQQGLQQGLEQGLEQGSQQEALALALRLLNRRFKKLSRRIERRLESLTVTQLEDLCEAVLDFNNLLELRQWLARQAGDHDGVRG